MSIRKVSAFDYNGVKERIHLPGPWWPGEDARENSSGLIQKVLLTLG